MKGNSYATQLTTYDLVSTSPSKLKYTFGVSKNPRFSKSRKGETDQIGYDLPTTKGTRAAGFGIGERFSDQKIKLKKSKLLLTILLTQNCLLDTNPSPDRYNIPTVF
jgi:hypothetical protein